jgi:hypothetical protein
MIDHTHLLDDLLPAQGAKGAPRRLGRPRALALHVPTHATPTKEWNRKHDALVSLLLINPLMSRKELAQRTGYSEAWVTMVTRSDGFRLAYGQARDQRVKSLAERSANLLYEQVEKSSEVVRRTLEDEKCDPRFALNAQEVALRSLGFSPKTATPQPTAAVQVNVNGAGVTAEMLARARDRLLAYRGLPLPEPELVG